MTCLLRGQQRECLGFSWSFGLSSPQRYKRDMLVSYDYVRHMQERLLMSLSTPQGNADNHGESQAPMGVGFSNCILKRCSILGSFYQKGLFNQSTDQVSQQHKLVLLWLGGK